MGCIIETKVRSITCNEEAYTLYMIKCRTKSGFLSRTKNRRVVIGT